MTRGVLFVIAALVTYMAFSAGAAFNRIQAEVGDHYAAVAEVKP